MDLVRDGATKLSREFFSEERTRGLQFFPATNPKIHVSQVQRLASKETPLLMENSMSVAGRPRRIVFVEMERLRVGGCRSLQHRTRAYSNDFLQESTLTSLSRTLRRFFYHFITKPIRDQRA